MFLYIKTFLGKSIKKNKKKQKLSISTEQKGELRVPAATLGSKFAVKV